MVKIFIHKEYKYKIWQILLLLLLVTLVVWLASIIFGNIMKPESNLARPDFKEQFPFLITIVILTSVLTSFLIFYTRLLNNLKILNLNKISFTTMMLIILAGYTYILLGFARIFYAPGVDDGFAVLAIPLLFVNALWVLPLCGILMNVISERIKK